MIDPSRNSPIHAPTDPLGASGVAFVAQRKATAEPGLSSERHTSWRGSIHQAPAPEVKASSVSVGVPRQDHFPSRKSRSTAQVSTPRI
jgi:hypothetical protein